MHGMLSLDKLDIVFLSSDGVGHANSASGISFDLGIGVRYL